MRYLNLLIIVSIATLLIWFALNLLELFTDIAWVQYTRGYREYLFYVGLALNIITFILGRRKS